MQGNPVIAPHEVCKGSQLPAITGSTTRRTKSVAVAPRIKINRIVQDRRSPDLVALLSLAVVFKPGVAAAIQVAHRASAPVGLAIPAVLGRAVDLSPEPLAAAQPV